MSNEFIIKNPLVNYLAYSDFSEEFHELLRKLTDSLKVNSPIDDADFIEQLEEYLQE